MPIQASLIVATLANCGFYTIRGVKVMLDADLAEIYGYETRKFNEQVKNNIEKFDEDFRFQLTSEEFENLKSKIWTSSCGNSLNFDNFYKKGNLMSKSDIKLGWRSKNAIRLHRAGHLHAYDGSQE